LEKPGGAPNPQFTATKGYRWYSQKQDVKGETLNVNRGG